MISKRKEFLNKLKNPTLASLRRQIKLLRKEVKLFSQTVSSRYNPITQNLCIMISTIKNEDKLDFDNQIIASRIAKIMLIAMKNELQYKIATDQIVLNITV